MIFRPLSEIEKNIAVETLNNQRNGIISAAIFSSQEEDNLKDDDTATLASIKTTRVGSSLIKNALKTLVYKHVELQVCINDDLKFEQLKSISYHDVVNKLDFENVIDEKINCYHSIPLYLLREIFNRTKFELNKPLWRLFIVDKNMLIFHGHESLFDNFSALNFLKKLYQTINKEYQDNLLPNHSLNLFDVNFAKQAQFPKSIYESNKMYVPAVAKDLLHLQTQTFFKNIYLQTIKKPIDFLNNGTRPESQKAKSSIVFNFNDLCGNTVFGNISSKQYEQLKIALNEENISLKTFMATLSMLCLEPFTNSMNKNGHISFCFPMDLRKDLIDFDKNVGALNGLMYKNIIVECPLSMISEKAYNDRTFHNGYDPTNVKLSKKDPDFSQKLFEFKFNEIASYFEKSIQQRIRAWKRAGFNDDDFKRMKFGKKDSHEQRYFEINDFTEFNIQQDTGIEQTSEKYKPKEIFFVKSENPESFMSLSFTYCETNGMNICIGYPEGYHMEEYVNSFELLLTKLTE